MLDIYTLQELATPSIVSTTGFAEQNSSTALVLFNNIGGKGYIRVNGLSDDSLFEDNILSCFDNIFPLSYYGELHFPRKLKGAILYIYRCSSIENQNCMPPTCSDESLVGQGIPITMNARNDIVPDSIKGLMIIPGTGELNIKWNSIQNVNIFAYGLRILFQGQEILSGYVPGNTTSLNVELTGNRTYDVEVFGISTSGNKSLVSKASASPALESTSTIIFNVTSTLIGPVENAEVYIEGIDKGATDINGRLTVSGIPASPEGLPHDYLVIKKGFNDSIGNFIASSGTSIIESVIMSKFTGDKGSVVFRATCGKPCPGVYVIIENIINGITDENGIALVENLQPRMNIYAILTKPTYEFSYITIDILPGKTTISPPITMRKLPEGLGLFAFVIYDPQGNIIPDVISKIDDIQLEPTPTFRGTLTDRIPIGVTLPFEISKNGFDTVSGEFYIDPKLVGMSIEVIMYPEGTTPPEVGSVTVHPSVDSNGNLVDLAYIIIDGKWTGTTISIGETEFINLPVGIHSYKAFKEGYEDEVGTIEISKVPNEITPVLIPKSSNQVGTTNKFLFLYEMANMSIDRIVQLYREGYRLEEARWKYLYPEF